MNKLFVVLIIIVFSSCIGKHSSDKPKAEIREHLLPSLQQSGDTLNLDLSKSVIYWKGTKMRGAGYHSGEIDFKKGYFLLKENKIVGGEFFVKMNSIKVTDIPPTDPVPIKNLTNHLKAADFFDVESHPESHFEILEAKVNTGDSLQITGNLTIKGISRSIQISAIKDDQSFTTGFVIDRFLWNIAYKGNWADRTMVDRDIELKAELFW